MPRASDVKGGRQAAVQSAFLPSVSPFFGLLPREVWHKDKDLFFYSANFLPLAAGLAQTQNINVQADSDYLVVAINGTATDTAAPPVLNANPGCLIELFDVAAGRQFQNQPQHYLNVVGTAQNPGWMPFPKYVRASSTVQVTLTSLITTNLNVRVTLMGFKIFLS
jgi:hypothetical protein